MNKALFLDRDGVINKEKDYVYKIEDFEFIEGVFEALKAFQEAGYLLIIITNQAGIARGYYTENDFEILNNWMLDQFRKYGIEIKKVYYDPTHPENGVGKYKRESQFRKPNPGMILQAKQDFNLDLSASILVGDKESDIQAGKNAGVGINILVRTGYAVNKDKTAADYIIDNLSLVGSMFLKNSNSRDS